MRRMTLTLSLIAALALPARAEKAVSQQSQRDFDAAGIRVLKVENPRGFAEVKRSGDGRIHVWAQKQVRSRGAESQRLLDETQVETDRSGDAFTVRVRYPQGSVLRISFAELMAGGSTPRNEVQLSIEVPPGVAVEMRSSSGGLRTAGLAGSQRLASTSGEIRVEEAAGPVEATSTSGDIEATGLGAARLHSVSGSVSVERAAGVLRVSSTSGDIHVIGATDSLSVNTVSGEVEVDGASRGLELGSTSGDVTLRRVAGNVALSTSSGDVGIAALAGLKQARVTTVSGDVELTLPSGFGAAVDLQSSSGSLDVEMPLEVRTITRHVLRGTIGRGGARLDLKSSSGDLHIMGGGTTS
jgi:hypothetical protein